MRIVAFSDTHGSHEELVIPRGDVLVFAGDCCNYGRLQELGSFLRWIEKLRFPGPIIFVPGNHDWPCENQQQLAREWCHDVGVHLLIGHPTRKVINDTSYLFYGHPWTPRFNDWAFNVDRDSPEMVAQVQQIPPGLDVLISHGPPLGILDREHNMNLGCAVLLDRIAHVRPAVTIFGHIHDGHGESIIKLASAKELVTRCYNVSVMDRNYDVVHPPTIIDL